MSYHRMLWRSGTALISLGILSACQSHAPAFTQTSATGLIGLNSADAFARYHATSDASAKAALIDALKAHLQKERTSVSHYYYQMRPALDNHSLNKGADSLIMSILKTHEYSDQDMLDKYGERHAYREAADYLLIGETDDAPYLRYHDEAAGVLPDGDTVTKEAGVSDRYQEVATGSRALQREYRSCVKSASYDMDAQIKANPALTRNDAGAQAVIKALDGCLSDANANADKLKPQDSYQRSDIETMRTCATIYRTNLTDALASRRAITRYEGEDYDAYDSIYANYGACVAGYSASYEGDPYVYLERATRERDLEGYRAIKLCADTTAKAQAQLRAQGHSYQNSPRLFEESLYQHATCLKNDVVDKVFEDASLAKSEYGIDSMTSLNDFYHHYQVLKESSEDVDFDEYSYAYGSPFARAWRAYFEMKQAELDAGASPEDDFGIGDYSMVASKMIQAMRNTPEQMLAKNAYQYNNSRLSILTKINPDNRSYQGVLSVDFHAPTAVQSLQLPFALDFSQGLMNVDTSVVQPVMAMVSSRHAPLPSDFKTGQEGVMAFYLPDEIKNLVPAALVHDALVTGFSKGMAEIHNLAFSRVDISGDAFAADLGATSAVKLNLNLQQQGAILGIISKQLVADLSAYVDAHPELFSKPPKDTPSTDTSTQDDEQAQKSARYANQVKKAIQKWALLDKGFVSSDVGGVMQLIDAILPIDFHQSNYYYLDARGNLLGQVVKADVDNHLLQARVESLGLISYRAQDFQAHPLAAQLIAPANKSVMDGNAWLMQIKRYSDWQTDAIMARYDYDAPKRVAAEAELEAALKAVEEAAKAAEEAAAAAVGTD